ncbi:MAG TPA: hypothetical protein VIQ24_15395 [Pyrinomonadaceae bacterium]
MFVNARDSMRARAIRLKSSVGRETASPGARSQMAAFPLPHLAPAASCSRLRAFFQFYFYFTHRPLVSRERFTRPPAARRA